MKKLFKNHYVQAMLGIIIAVGLYACGGSGSSNLTSPTTPDSKPVIIGKNLANITLYDSPAKLAGVDANSNGIADDAESRIGEATKVFTKDLINSPNDAATQGKMNQVVSQYYKDLNSFFLTPNDQLPTTTKAAAEMYTKISDAAFCLAEKYELNMGDMFWSRMMMSAISTEEQRGRMAEFEKLDHQYFAETGKVIHSGCY